MLLNVSLRIKLCLERAANARELATRSGDPDESTFFLRLEQRWNDLARSRASRKVSVAL